MAKLIYGSGDIEIEFDERTLAHVHVVISTKLRQGESFMFSWTDDKSVGDGRSSVWLHPSIPIYFKFEEATPPELNRDWINALFMTANSGAGLRLLPETSEGEVPTGRPSQTITE